MKDKYRIGEIAKIKNIDPQTLRYYDKQGILSPDIIDEENGYRYYSREQFVDVDRVKFCKKLGLSLDEIKEFREVDDIHGTMKTLLKQQKRLEDEIKRITEQKSNVDDIISSIEVALEALSGDEEDSFSIEHNESIYGIREKCLQIKNWFEFEQILNGMMEKYPYYNRIGHNFKLIRVKELDLIGGSLGKWSEVIMPIDKEYVSEPNVEKIELGKCLVGYFRGGYHASEAMLCRVKKYMDTHNLKPKDKVYLVPIINSFILADEKEEVERIIIPIE